MTTQTLDTDDATLAYDVHEPDHDADRPPLLMAGSPMTAEGFTTLRSSFTDRTVVTYDPRGLGRSTRRDGHTELDAMTNGADLHALLTALGPGPVDVFASSGGAINALALVAAHPHDVGTLVAHEPPLVSMLPDAEHALAAEDAVQKTYRDRGWGAGMAAFIAMTSWQGQFTDDYFSSPPPDPGAFGLPTRDDGSRDDPLLSGRSNGVTRQVLDLAAVASAPTRVVVAAGVGSRGTITWRTAEATAAALDVPLTTFPSHHAGFLGGEFGQTGEPEAFAARLHEVLDEGR